MLEERFWELLAKKLSGELLPGEEREWLRLRQAFPHLQFSAESLEKLWTRPHADPSEEARAALHRHLQRMSGTGHELPEAAPEKKPAVRRLQKWMALPVLTLFIAGIWLLTRSINSAPQKQRAQGLSEVSTRPGSRTRVLLPDSTVVWLNAGSKLTCAEGFGVTNRNTTLIGEAFFDVTHNAALPFTIKASDVRIRVLGTAFNVKAYPGEATETSLIRGQVQLTLEKRPGETYRLRPNEKLVVNGAEGNRHQPIVLLQNLDYQPGKDIEETAWIDNKLVFRNETLAMLATRMSRWYNVSVEIADEDLAGERVSGAFVNEGLQQALDELQLIVRFRLEQQGGRYILSLPKKD